MAAITIKEIAKLVGVSTATVSRVLNDSGGYSVETKQRVMEVLNKFNYKTNAAARSLRTNRSKTIGVIVPDITNEYYAQIALAIENFFVPNGYSIFIYNTSGNPEKESQLMRDLESRGVDGLIYISGTGIVLKEALKRGLPIVCINRHKVISDEMYIVESDNYRGGFMATEELLQQGCKRIVILRDKRDIVPMNERQRGYEDALRKYEFPVESDLIQRIFFDVYSATECVEMLLERNIHFDGIFASSDMLAIGALKALRDNQKLVPKEIKVVGFDNSTFGQHSHPTLTTIDQNNVKLGEAASNTLLQIIGKKEIPKQSHIVIPITLIKRESTG